MTGPSRRNGRAFRGRVVKQCVPAKPWVDKQRAEIERAYAEGAQVRDMVLKTLLRVGAAGAHVSCLCMGLEVGTADLAPALVRLERRGKIAPVTERGPFGVTRAIGAYRAAG
jgi:hypothetical protein